MVKLLDGNLFFKMLNAGAANLSDNKEDINNLNVFPIPDGDTGENMLMTAEGGLSLVPEHELGKTAAAVSDGMLLSARGNSGVILSRIFSGIAKGLRGISDCDLINFDSALISGVRESYGAVSKPVEGTILTVFREGVEYAGGRLNDDSTFESYFKDLLDEFNRSLERTPELLDVLKESGVVDSGGAGLICIFNGMNDALNGAKITHISSTAAKPQKVDINMFTADSVLEFGYCTEFLLRLQKSKVDIDNFDFDGFSKHLNEIGDSVVTFADGTIVKVHVHTMKPGDILDYCQQFGEFLTMKIENMTLQHNETENVKNQSFKKKEVKKPYGIVSVASGKGIKETFMNLGCDHVVEGGQSMNPSTEDFIRAFEKINAETILVYPNNGNIILGAQQAADLYDNAKICIIPTKTVGEGYAAISMLDTSLDSLDDIIAEQKEIISAVVTGVVSKAVRDTEKDGIAVTKDDYIGFVGDKIIVDDSSKDDALLLLSEKLNASRYDIMLVIYGETVSEQESVEIEKMLRAKYRRTEIVMIYGGQPIYDYILVLE
ncbi:MAG: DAK2 domain-containing protein [Ruminococcus sp.]|nr:DAK2 domain-containing protein [Ruminococcus sp.]